MRAFPGALSQKMLNSTYLAAVCLIKKIKIIFFKVSYIDLANLNAEIDKNKFIFI